MLKNASSSFIDKNKEIICQILQNAAAEKPLLEVSERLTALQNRSSDRRGFIKTVQMEQKIYCENCQDIIVSGLDRYIDLIKEKIKVKVQNKSILDGPSSCLQYGVNIRTLGSIHNTVEYVLFPEIVTRFIMKLKNLNHKNASCLLYGDGKRLPIEHH